MNDSTSQVPPLIRLADAGAMGRQLVTVIPLAQGQLVAPIDGYQILDRPTRTSVFIGNDRHLDALGLITNLNHSCHPSTVVDTARLLLIATRDLRAGEPLTFFYPSTEWDMAEPFDCLCGSEACIGRVRGAKYLSRDVLSAYFLNRHIDDLLEEQCASLQHARLHRGARPAAQVD